MRKQTYSSPMSYIGITRRSTAWIRRVGDTPLKTGLAAIAVGLFLAVMYAVLLGWYFVIFVLFGVFTFPYRLVRRSHRKQEHLQKQQLATMQAMLIQQQQALNQNKDAG
jgi:membrane protein implicated in regulation of membrane protease activity